MCRPNDAEFLLDLRSVKTYSTHTYEQVYSIGDDVVGSAAI